MASIHLIDSPKRLSLSEQSKTLRSTLKDWEKAFAASNDGRKPSKDDIKACADIVKTYKKYNKIRDVLAGKLDVEALDSPSRSPRRRAGDAERLRSNRGQLSTPRNDSETLSFKAVHSSQLDLYDRPISASPRRYLVTAIGPTPQRDGKILGLFDLLSNSGHSSQATPSTRKRKRDLLTEQAANADPSYGSGGMAQTPSRKAAKIEKQGAVLGVDADRSPASRARHHSRTPASESKKLLLNQFFASPTTMRYTSIVQDVNPESATKTQGDLPSGLKVQTTPLRDYVLGGRGLDPSATQPPQAPDATPAYLKRSVSFKDRLLSVSTSAQASFHLRPTTAVSSPAIASNRLNAHRRYRSAPKPLSEIVRDLRKLEDEGHDDDLEALRELEGADINVGTGECQTVLEESGAVIKRDVQDENEPSRKWKKKGQKRTTRRANMRPVRMKPRDANQWATTENGNESEDELAAVTETNIELAVNPGLVESDVVEVAGGTQCGEGAVESDSNYGGEDDDFDDDFSTNLKTRDKSTKKPRTKSKNSLKENEGKNSMKPTRRQPQKKAGTIKPNAVSHMNFRSLKIKNKNSKAKKGGGRFGRKLGRR